MNPLKLCRGNPPQAGSAPPEQTQAPLPQACAGSSSHKPAGLRSLQGRFITLQPLAKGAEIPISTETYCSVSQATEKFKE